MSFKLHVLQAAIIMVGSLPLAETLVAQQPTAITWNNPPASGATVGNHTTVPLNVSVLAAGVPVPGGTVTFFDGIYLLGTASVQFNAPGTLGQAVLNASFAGGSHSLTASYSGLTTATPASSFLASSTAAPLPLNVTGQELVTMNCSFYGSAFGLSYGQNYSVLGTNPGAYDCFSVEGYSRQALSGVVSMTDSANPGMVLFPTQPLSGSYYTQLSGAFSSPPIIPIDSFITADIANLGVAGVIGLSRNAQTIWVQPLLPVSMTQDSNGITFGNGQPAPSGLAQASNQTYPVAVMPVQVVAADVNGDGNLDLVVAHNDSAAAVGVLLGNGDGTFRPEATFALPNGNPAVSLAVGDVNGDGFPDLVVTNSGNQITVLSGAGDGTFPHSGGTFSAGNGASQIALADLNGDGILDIAVMNVTDATIGILQGNGDGTFLAQLANPAGTQPIAFAIADLNNDGTPDITVAGTAGPSQGELTFLSGQGSTLTYQQQYFACDLSGNGTVNGQYTSIQATDMDGDGIPDLLLGYNFSGYSLAITSLASPFSPNPSYLPGSCYPLNFNPGNSVANQNSLATSSMAAADLTGNGVKDMLTIPAGATYGIAGYGTSTFNSQLIPFNLGGPFGSPRTVDLVFTPAAGSVYGAGASPTTTVTDQQYPQATLSLNSQFLFLAGAEPGASSVASVTLTNTGYAPLIVSGIALPYNQRNVFSQVNTCTVPLLRGDPGCTITITFTPVYSSSLFFGGTLAISDNDPISSPQGYALSAAAIPDPVSSPSPTGVAFGNQQINTTSAMPQTIVVSNTGFANLVFNGSPMASTSEFQVVGGTCTPTTVVAPTASCTILVVFAPTMIGPQMANVTIPVAYSYGGATTVMVSGTGTTGTAAPVVSLNPTSLAFGNQAINTTSASQMVTVSNTGTAVLNISSVVAGTGYTVSGCSGAAATVAAGSSCVLTIAFAPGTSGADPGTVTITDNATPVTQTIMLTGTGTAAPVVSLNPTSLAFGNQAINTTSASQTVTVSNTGNAVLNISSVVAGTGYTVSGCSGAAATVAARSSCVLTIAFAPGTSGADPGTVTITDNATPVTQTIMLTGTGTAAPVVSLNPTSLAFGNQAINTTSASQTVTVSNTGTAVLNISSVVAGAGYTVSGCSGAGATVAAGSSCVLTIAFAPGTSGADPGTVTITDNATPVTQTIMLTGTGTAAPVVSLNPTSLAFGNQPINTTSASQTVTVSNTGSAVLNISSVVAGTGYAVSGCSGAAATVAAGSSCVLTIAFAPGTSGADPGTVTITDNATPVTQTIMLTGTGTAAPVVSLNPTSLAFGNQAINTTSASQTVTVSNTGTAVLNISSVVASTGYTVSGCSGAAATVAAGSSCVLTIAFAPGTSGADPGTVTITDNATPVTQTIMLTGTGTAPVATLSTTSIAAGGQGIALSVQAGSVTVTNTGNAPLTFAGTPYGVMGAGASSWRLLNQGCSGTLAPGASCTILVYFDPAGAGPLPATLSINDNAANSPQQVSLTGTGVTPALAIGSTSLSFGTVNVGVTSAPQTITINNTGTVGLYIGTPTLSGANPNAFAFISQCTVPGAGILPGQSCTIAITFTPTGVGSETATLSIPDYAAGAPQLISLSGTGAAPTTTLSPGNLNFGNVTTGTTSAGQIILVTNTGTQNLTFNSITITGANPASYSTTNICGPVLPGGVCRIVVFFSPGSAASLPATLTVSDNAVGSPQTVTLTGTGVTGPVDDTASVTVSTSAFTYNHATKIYSGTVTVTNSGAVSLNGPLYAVLTGLPVGVTATNQTGNAAAGPYYALTGVLGPGGSQTFAVTFSDPSAVLLSFTARIYSGAVQ